jgi:hypothetical protein
VARLVSASLVLHEGGRYRLLEPIRQVAEQLLDATADVDASRQRHAEYFLVLVDSVQGALWGRSARGGGISRLETDVDNLRAALGWFVDRGESESAGQLGAGLARFWLFSERVAEGRNWLARLLELSGLSGRTRARLLVGAGASATYELDLGLARSLLELAWAPRALRARTGRSRGPCSCSRGPRHRAPSNSTSTNSSRCAPKAQHGAARLAIRSSS